MNRTLAIKSGACVLVAVVLTLCAQSWAATTNAAPSVNFDREIRPILSENCFTCHGPDEGKRKSRLRLDRREDALKPAKSGERAIVPGDVAKSELIARVTTTDEDDRMPPPNSGKTLTSSQIDLLRRWIASGAEWQTHWAFVPPVRPPLPPVSDPGWPRNDIDHFVMAKLDKDGLKPAPEADKATLIRRASLDVTGLPPTVDGVDAFLADGSPDAYEKVVDRLMTMSRMGEHQARYWLDAARYADTHGYHIDSKRDMWKYRDWVIQAFNRNKPFDQFTIEQLAGDLVPNSSVDQKIASGYVRANMTTGEGGVIEDDYRAKYTFDRVETMAAMYLGLTLTCARCHSHKYDPIQQKEYYGVYAIFNQLDDPVMDGNQPNPAPILAVPSDEQAARLAWLKEHIKAADETMALPIAQLDQAQSVWENFWRQEFRAGWVALSPVDAGSTLTNGAALGCPSGDAITIPEGVPASDVHEIVFQPEPRVIGAFKLEFKAGEGTGVGASNVFAVGEVQAEIIPAAEGEAEVKPRKIEFAFAAADAEEKGHEAARLLDGNAESTWILPGSTNGATHRLVFVTRKPVVLEPGAEIKMRLRYPPSATNGLAVTLQVKAAVDEDLVALLHPPMFEPWHVLGPLKTEAVFHEALQASFDPERAVDLKQKFPGVREEAAWSERRDLEDGKPNLLVQDLHGVHGVRYLFRSVTAPDARPLELDVRADGLFRLWVNGQVVAKRDREEAPGEGPVTTTVHLRPGKNEFLLKIVTVQGASYFTFRPDLGSSEVLTGDVAAIMAAAAATQPAVNAAKLRHYFRRQHSAEYRDKDNALVHWREEQQTVDRAIPRTMIAKDSEKPRETHLLMRGEYDKQGEVVAPGLFAVLPPLPAGAPTNRLGLAKWLVDPAHPLTARVTVNRFWQEYFGVGLVKTTEDFGMQGEHPVNPGLLDYLATEFVESGWNMKHLRRLMLTSATYRQSSRASKELIARDPENRLLARGPRFRMDGEMVRDTALYVSGLLVEKTGGHSVRPYEPPGLWEAVSFNGSQKYVQDLGAAQYRRSLYTFWKRQSPPPAMLIFDAPSREFCTLRRSRSNTPLQALTLLNDPQFVEASRAFAQRMMLEGGATIESRAIFGFRMVAARVPTSDEVRILRQLFQEQKATFDADASAVQQYLNVGSFRARADLDPAELAAWTTVASMLLNLDETVTKG